MKLEAPTPKYLPALGSRLTEIGMLPHDWSVQRLGNVSTCVTGLTYSPADVAEYGTLVLRSSNIQDGRLAFSDCVFVQMALPDRVITREGDLLVCVRNGSRSLIGKSALIDSSAAGSAFGAFMSVLRSDDGPYLRQIFDTASLKRQIEQGMGATINQITNRDMDALLVPWPGSREERKRIGAALADADALIDSLEQLLTKKRQIKQGAMQELLTGKRRLPGFGEPWKNGTLGQSVVELIAGVSVNSDVLEGNVGVPSVVKTSAMKGGVFDPSECKPIVASDIARAVTQPRKDTLLISRMNTPDLVGEVGYVDRDYDWLYLPDRIWMTRTRSPDSVCVRWLGYLLSSAPYKRRIADTATGTSGSMKNIAKAALLNVMVAYPKIEEQVAIAQLLSDMDAGITVLESRLTKARAVKQSMAQTLLTGRIRLVEHDA